MQNEYWPSQPAMTIKYKNSTAVTVGDLSYSLMHSQNQIWGNASDFDNAATLDNALQIEPHITSDVEGLSHLDTVFNFDPIAAQNMVDKGNIEYYGQFGWTYPQLHDLPRGVSMNGSDLDTSNSLSPRSYLSDNLESEMSLFSPTSMSDQSTPGSHWVHLVQGDKGPSLYNTPLRPHMAVLDAEVSADADLSGLPRMISNIGGSPLLSAKAAQSDDVLDTSFNETSWSSFEYPRPYTSSSSCASWYLPSNAASLPLRSPQTQQNITSGDTPTDASLSHSRSRFIVPSQNQLEGRFQITQNTDGQNQRKLNDEILIQGKKDGSTYKDIRKMMIGEKPAESTLRGRYRSLTKARKDRVRKPVWKKRDVSPFFALCANHG